VSTAHSILEIRTSKDSQESAETAVQLLATLPKLRQQFYDYLLGRHEHLSFEILVEEQQIHFLTHVPTRLLEYFKGALQASYPQATLTPRSSDPVDQFAGQKRALRLARLRLKNHSYLPLKTYTDFKDIDPLSTLLATLSKNQVGESILIQMIVQHDSTIWPKQQRLSAEQLQSHPQQALIANKADKRHLNVAFKIAVLGADKTRSKLLMENIAAAYQAISQSEGNALELRTQYLLKNSFLRGMRRRQASRHELLNLSLEEVATLYHLPNQKLANIDNISWGKKLMGEAPEQLPIVSKDSSDETKDQINIIAEAVYKNRPVKYGLLRNDRRRHVYVIGKTGTGKSTLLANMAINDLKHNEGMCIIDPHGDLVETLLDFIPKHRINDVVYFDPADQERTVQINLFEGENVVHRELIASGIISVFQKLYGYSWGPRLEYILRNALLTLL
jgi:hypothetical protein